MALKSDVRVAAGGTWRGFGRTNVTPGTVATGFTNDVTRPVWLGTGNTSNNVGCLVGVPRTTVSTVTQAAGKRHENLTITGNLTITQPGQTFYNCRFTYSYAGDNGGGVIYMASSALNAPAAPTRFEFCEVEPTNPGDRWNGLYGHDYIAYRSAFSKNVDGFGAYNSSGQPNNVEVSCCWVGNLAWFDKDWTSGRNDGHPDGSGTHNDGIQNGGCPVVNVHGTFFQGAKYNVLNPTNCTLTEDGLDYVLSNGNGVTPLDEAGTYGKPQSGNCYIGKADAFAPVDDIIFRKNWVWNFSHGFFLNSTLGSTIGGGVSIINATVENNIFGGRWGDFGGTWHYYPIRYDNNCVVNGVRRAGGAVATDTWGNVWDANANPGVNYSDGTPVAGSAVRHRVDTRTAA
jgi:hypothetical protein